MRDFLWRSTRRNARGPAFRRHAALVLGIALFGGVLCGVAVAGNHTGTTTTTSSGNSSGVKPGSTTKHNTHAQAGSNKTKQYGNGKTAGQIAEKNGATSTTDLYGPGNSQPHKVAACSKNGKTHSVDVHALKSHGAAACPSGGTPTGGTPATSTNSSSSGSPNTAGATIGATGKTNPGATAGSSTTPANTGVLGASKTASATKIAAHAKTAHAVLGTASFTG